MNDTPGKITKAGRSLNDSEIRKRFAGVRVLLADQDPRSAWLVRGILFSFGFRTIDHVGNGEDALHRLATLPFDLIITEFSMGKVDGLAMVKAIRAAKDGERIRRDIPIIMLTGRADADTIHAARDAGITEFVAKPFSAKTISERIILVIDKPRVFVDAPGFAGPCRRRKRSVATKIGSERRTDNNAKATISPANKELRKHLGKVSARDILNEMLVTQAQADLQGAEGVFIEWAREDIAKLEAAFLTLQDDHTNEYAAQHLFESAYHIKSQAGVFGFDLGTEVASLLMNYLREHPHPSADDMLIIRKHIDVIAMIFNQTIKDSNIGNDLLASLRKLIVKLG